MSVKANRYSKQTIDPENAMEAAYDLVVRGGTVADGRYGALRGADVGVRNGTIATMTP